MKFNQWKNTQSVINLYKNIKRNKSIDLLSLMSKTSSSVFLEISY